MEKIITDFNQLDLSKSYTYADYMTWRFDELVEIIKRKIFKLSPAPNTFHQMISANILTLLKVATKGQKCKAFAAPTDVRLITKDTDKKNITTFVQPDLFKVCDPSKLDDKGCVGSPDLIIEILSTSTSAKDLYKNLTCMKRLASKNIGLYTQAIYLSNAIYYKMENISIQGFMQKMQKYRCKPFPDLSLQ